MMQDNSKKSKKTGFRNFIILVTLALLLLISLTTFHKDNSNREPTFDDKVREILLDWYKLYLQLERIDKNAEPPYAARNLAQISTGVYEVVMEHRHFFKSESPQALRLLNHTFYISLSDIFDQSNVGSAATLINGLYQATNKKLHTKMYYNDLFVKHIIEENNKRFRVDTLDKDTMVVWPTYKPIKEFTFSDHKGMLPNWGENKTLIVKKNFIRVNPPYERAMYFEKALYDDALSVYVQSKRLTFEDKWIGGFWSDETAGLTFTPVGRWVSIANQTIAMEHLPSLKAIKMYRDLSVSLYDVTIIGWHYKYMYNLMRPEQFIRKYIDSTWSAKHHPDFPSYPSAHSFIAGAAGGILEYYFDKDAKRIDSSHYKRIEFYSDKRMYDSFEAMYKECAYSRFLVGVHYLSDCEAGLNLGLSVANTVINSDE